MLLEATEPIPLPARHRYGDDGTVGSRDFMLDGSRLPNYATADRFTLELRLTAPDGAAHEARYELARQA